MRMIAKFRGTCRECNGAIKRGQPIDWARNQGAAHEACATPAIKPEGLRPGYGTAALLEDERQFEYSAGDGFMAALRSECGR